MQTSFSYRVRCRSHCPTLLPSAGKVLGLASSGGYWSLGLGRVDVAGAHLNSDVALEFDLAGMELARHLVLNGRVEGLAERGGYVLAAGAAG